MALRTQHRLLVPLFLVSFLVGGVAGYLDVPGEVMLWLLLGGAGVTCGGWHLYRRRLQDRGEFDERDRRIEHRSANLTLGAIYLALLVLLGLTTFTEHEPLGPAVLLGLLFGGTVLQVGFEKWYSRRM